MLLELLDSAEEILRPLQHLGVGNLLAHGAVLDDADDRGRTAVMIAAELGYGDVVELLLARGADRARKDKQGKTALDLATNADVREKLSAK